MSNSGVVHKDVEAAKLRDDAGHQGINLRGAADIDLERVSGAALVPDLLRYPIRGRAVHIHHRQRCALARKAPGDFAANAAPVTRAVLLASVMNSSRPGWGRPGACPTGSELDAERHLHDAPATGRRDLTEAAAGQVARGVRELSVIQRVERVPPEVHGPLFQEPETLVEGEVEVLLT